jgi:hypothetical protein
MAWTQAEAEKTVTDVLKLATTDEAYRKLALSDPAAAVAKVNSNPLPPGFKIKMFDNAGNNMTIVLPDMVAKGGELSDAELEQVAGGVGDNNRCGGSCAASCVISSVL